MYLAILCLTVGVIVMVFGNLIERFVRNERPACGYA